MASSSDVFYQMRNVANCELSDSNESDVMYLNFENSSDGDDENWSFYERLHLRRDFDNDDQCFDGKRVY